MDVSFLGPDTFGAGERTFEPYHPDRLFAQEPIYYIVLIFFYSRLHASIGLFFSSNKTF